MKESITKKCECINCKDEASTTVYKHGYKLCVCGKHREEILEYNIRSCDDSNQSCSLKGYRAIYSSNCPRTCSDYGNIMYINHVLGEMDEDTYEMICTHYIWCDECDSLLNNCKHTICSTPGCNKKATGFTIDYDPLCNKCFSEYAEWMCK